MAEFLETNGPFSCILSCICLIIVIGIVSHFIKYSVIKEYKNQIGYKLWKISWSLKMAILSYFFFLLFVIYLIIFSFYWTFDAKPNNKIQVQWCRFMYFQKWPLTFGKISLYLFWFFRIHQSFKGSLFEISAKKLKIMAIIFNVPALMVAAYVFYMYFMSTFSLFSLYLSISNRFKK